MNYLLYKIDTEQHDYGKLKEYSDKDYSFNYISRKQLKRIDDYCVVGYTFLKEVNRTTDCDKLVVHSSRNQKSPKLYKLCETTKKRGRKYFFVKGYVPINEENSEFIVIRRHKTFWMLLSLLIVLLLGIGITAATGNKFLPIETEGTEITEDEKVDKEFYQENIAVPGYYDITVTKDSPNLRLLNPKENQVYFVYDIKIDNNSLYTTKAIAPGMMAEINIYDLLPAGKTTVTLDITTYDINTQVSCNGAIQSIIITKE